MKYKDGITEAMTTLGKKKDTVFLGEGLINAGKIYGTMEGVDSKKCIEFPIAENLIMGAAIGLAINGFRPVVIFQRMDFMTCACDAIINHLPKMSGDKIKLPVIIRAIIGSRDSKFDVGIQHNKDLTDMFKPWIYTVVLKKNMDIPHYYNLAYEMNGPTLIIEDRDLYEESK
jgi:pyruvate/2-oxoglutarate/acetoin dehydrogenase E1 component